MAFVHRLFKGKSIRCSLESAPASSHGAGYRHIQNVIWTSRGDNQYNASKNKGLADKYDSLLVYTISVPNLFATMESSGLNDYLRNPSLLQNTDVDRQAAFLNQIEMDTLQAAASDGYFNHFSSMVIPNSIREQLL